MTTTKDKMLRLRKQNPKGETMIDAIFGTTQN